MRPTIARLSLACVLLVIAPPVCAQSETSDADQAMELFNQSAEAYRRGDFQEAADLLTRAYELQPEPVLQYNLARALEGLGDLGGALDAYTVFLRDMPETPDRGAIEARMQTLRRQIEERRALEARSTAPVEPEQTEPAPADVAPQSASPSPAPWVLAGAGVAGLVVGVVLGVEAEARNSGAMEEPVHRTAAALVDEAQDFALAANVTFGIAGALAIAGFVWGIIDLTGGDEDGEPRARVRVGPTSVAVVVPW